MRIDINQLKFIHPKLRRLATRLEQLTGVEFTITSLRRIGDLGIHGTDPLRAIDLRCRSPDLGHLVEELIDARYIYDPQRPELHCAMFHNVGRGAHIHLQVSDETLEAVDA